MSGGLDGRVAVVTGVSRRRGIGYAIACRLACAGASVFLQHYSPHDAAQPWGADDVDEVVAGVRRHLTPGARMGHASIDLSTSTGPATLIDWAGALASTGPGHSAISTSSCATRPSPVPTARSPR